MSTPPKPSAAAVEQDAARRLSFSAGSRRKVDAMRARDARGRRTMDLIHAALLKLIEERPFERITVDDILKRSGIGRATFYRHYADKQALIEEVARAEITRIIDLVVPLVDDVDSLPCCRRLADHVGANRELWRVLLTGGAAGVMRQKFIELTTPEPSSPRAVPRYGIPVELTAKAGVAATVEILSWWLRDFDAISVDEIADYIDRLAVRPAFDPPRRPSADNRSGD